MDIPFSPDLDICQSAVGGVASKSFFELIDAKVQETIGRQDISTDSQGGSESLGSGCQGERTECGGLETHIGKTSEANPSPEKRSGQSLRFRALGEAQRRFYCLAETPRCC